MLNPRIFSIVAAKMRLSRIINYVGTGTAVVTARGGGPLIQPVPINPAVEAEKLGFLKDKIEVPEDFNAPLDEETMALFEGS